MKPTPTAIRRRFASMEKVADEMLRHLVRKYDPTADHAAFRAMRRDGLKIGGKHYSWKQAIRAVIERWPHTVRDETDRREAAYKAAMRDRSFTRIFRGL